MAATREDVRRMFDAIAPTYDLLNRILSFGVDVAWRRRLLQSLGPIEKKRVLDVACGTGDLLLALSPGRPETLVGIDLSPRMLSVAKDRLEKRAAPATLITGAAEALPFNGETFDVVTVAFGVRNFEDLEAGLSEMRRVLRRGGQLRVLEFSRPRSGAWGALFRWYFVSVLPRIGRWVSGHPEAYSYLPASVATFPDSSMFGALLRRAGFTHVASMPLTGGIVTLTVAE